MSVRILAERYAMAFVNVCKDFPRLREYMEFVDEWSDFLRETPKVRKLLEHPITPFQKKRNIVERLENFSRYPEEVQKFILYLIQKERIDCFPFIVEALHKYIAEQEDVIRGTLRLGTELSPSAQEKVIKHLEKQLGKKLQVKVETDPSLLGGMVLHTENKILDASVRNNFKKFLQQLQKGV